jgi:MFS transporter, DHA2 family, multidrug resistance protein
VSTAQAITAEQAFSEPQINPWVIGVVVSLAAFMEVLDTSIANVALPYIAGSLGASYDESTWVLTSYLASNAIVLPITGWLAQVFGRKNFFMLCIAMFTLSSFFCAAAPSLGLLLLFRVLQGAFGGGLQPMAQAILADTFPPKQRGLAFALYGVTAVVGPAAGPIVGGWLTDNYVWRWIFYINVPVGILALLLVYQLVKDPPSSVKRAVDFSRFDYLGFSFLAIGIAALQVVLDKGQEDDWFGSHFILSLAITAVVCLTVLIIWEFRAKEPIVDVRLFRNFNFASTNLMMLIVGIALYASNVLVPQLLQTQMGYTAELAGLVLGGGAALLLLALPIVGQLLNRYPAKYLVTFGWLTLSIAMFVSTRATDLLMSFSHSATLRVLQILPIGFLFIPITLSAYVGLSAEKSNSAAGLINFMRNMGGSIGTSIVATVIARRSQYHQSILVQHTRSTQFLAAANRLAMRLSHAGIGHADAHTNAVARLARIVQAQAAVLSYIDLYWMLAVATTIMFFLSFWLKKNKPGDGGEIPAG